MLAFVLITVPAKQAGGVTDDLRKLPGVIEAHALYGDRDVIAKLEVADNKELDQLVMVFPPGTMEFWNIRGALFFDVGNAWEDTVDSLAGSFGFSFRLLLAYSFIFRLDVAKTTEDFHGISKDTPVKLYVGASF